MTATLATGHAKGKDLLAMRDVALYAAVCSMASVKRSELQNALLRAPGIRELLGTIPGLHDAVLDFVRCRFKQAFAFLTKISSVLAGTSTSGGWLGL